MLNSRTQGSRIVPDKKMGAAVVSSVYHVMHFLNAIVTFYRCELIRILVSQTNFAFTFIG